MGPSWNILGPPRWITVTKRLLLGVATSFCGAGAPSNTTLFFPILVFLRSLWRTKNFTVPRGLLPVASSLSIYVNRHAEYMTHYHHCADLRRIHPRGSHIDDRVNHDYQGRPGWKPSLPGTLPLPMQAMRFWAAMRAQVEPTTHRTCAMTWSPSPSSLRGPACSLVVVSDTGQK
jgi:hypothetical protein